MRCSNFIVSLNHSSGLKAVGKQHTEFYGRLKADHINVHNPIRTANILMDDNNMDGAVEVLMWHWHETFM